jgi:hypothetical protein
MLGFAPYGGSTFGGTGDIQAAGIVNALGVESTGQLEMLFFRQIIICLLSELMRLVM